MKPTPGILRRVLTAVLAILPPLAGMDLCTAGAFAGRADLMCGMERTATACHAEAAPPACAHCVPAAPAPEPAPEPVTDRGPTCCDLRPQAAGAGEAPALPVPLAASHPAVAAPSPAAPRPATPATCVVTDADLAPPGGSPPPLSPRAPPLG